MLIIQNKYYYGLSLLFLIIFLVLTACSTPKYTVNAIDSIWNTWPDDAPCTAIISYAQVPEKEDQERYAKFLLMSAYYAHCQQTSAVSLYLTQLDEVLSNIPPLEREDLLLRQQLYERQQVLYRLIDSKQKESLALLRKQKMAAIVSSVQNKVDTLTQQIKSKWASHSKNKKDTPLFTPSFNYKFYKETGLEFEVSTLFKNDMVLKTKSLGEGKLGIESYYEDIRQLFQDNFLAEWCQKDVDICRDSIFISLEGHTDGLPLRRTLKYPKGSFTIPAGQYYTVYHKDGRSEYKMLKDTIFDQAASNEQLGLARAFKAFPSLQSLSTHPINLMSIQHDGKGNEFRKVIIKITAHNLFQESLNNIPDDIQLEITQRQQRNNQYKKWLTASSQD